MKPCLHFLVCALAPFILLLVGCSGGGGGGQRNPDPQPAPAGQGFDPAAIDAIDAALLVRCKGQVFQRMPNGRDLPLSGVAIRVTSGGSNVGNAVTGRNGVYHVNLRRGQHNAVRASLAGFEFNPPAILAAPQQPEILASIIGTSAGGGQPGGGNAPGALGDIYARFSGPPASDPLNDTRLEILNVDTGMIKNVVVAGRRQVLLQEPVGSRIRITPISSSGRPWQPDAITHLVDPRTHFIDFRWPDPVISVLPAAPTPRPVLSPLPRLTPPATPIPRVPLPQATRPPVVIPPQQANPRPKLQPTPIPRIPSRPLPPLPEGSS
jgi:hypothetical protein